MSTCKISCLCLLFFLAGIATAQKNELLVDGIKLEKAFKVEAALEKFETVLKSEPTNAEALHHASRMLSNIGGRMHRGKRDTKIQHYEKAKAYAERSIQFNPKSADARLAYIISLGLMSEIAINPREKIKNAKTIRNEAETIVRLDSTFSQAYFVLGKWHYELARLNWLEQLACKFLGGLPDDISMDASMKYFNQAIALDPENILYLYGLASLYHYQDNDSQAEKILQHAVQLSPREPDDVQRKEKCALLLSQIKRTS
jgi:tetratricopeptide (TPR) repeat protein